MELRGSSSRSSFRDDLPLLNNPPNQASARPKAQGANPYHDNQSTGSRTSSAYNSYSFTATGSSSSAGTAASSIRRRGKMSVEGDWRVDATLKQREDVRPLALIILPVVKWVVTILAACLILAALMSAKVSLLVLAQKLREARSQNDANDEGWTRYTAMFILMFLVLAIPPAVNMLRALWFGVLDKAVPWPSIKAIFLSVLNAALEAVGLCVMCYWVLGQYSPPLSLLLLAAPILLPSVDNLILTLTLRGKKLVSLLPVWLSCFGMVASVLGVGVGGYLMSETTTLDTNLWHVVIAILCLSIAWLPSFLRRLALTDDVDPALDRDIEEDLTLSSSNTISSSELERRHALAHSSAAQQVQFLPAAWKAAFILHTFKLLFVIAASILIYSFDSGVSVSRVFSGNQSAFIDAWDLTNAVDSSAALVAVSVTMGTGLAAYALSFATCHLHIMRGALAPPLILVTPLVLTLLLASPICEALIDSICEWDSDYVIFYLVGGICFAVAHLGFTWRLFHSDPVLLLQESKLFIIPGYSGAAQDTGILLNARPILSSLSGKKKVTSKGKTKIYICTTMYREEEHEMRQLLESINLINKAQAEGERCFESHIVFDGGVKQRELSEFALVLVSLLESTLGIKPETCTKVATPYGLKLSWALPGPRSKAMPFNIHLKDSMLVKNKKRWSQVMYMSYVLDFLEQEDEESFILTTDADVLFTPDSVEALLDLMTRDQTIGAVCARTHPTGGGPLVWYQLFEYAIGHWFQKAAEHVLGSVLCAPGCFSVYRCRALADVLPKYSRRVETPFDFLTKDMGEDRWLCTLMVQSGWRIEYCAAAENITNCPSQFEEFYKQRRRWVASTLANLMLIVKEWRYVRVLNYGVPLLFLFYQCLLLFSTLIGPSTVILIVSSGLSYAWSVDVIATIIVQILMSLFFAFLCLYASQNSQITAAKAYTFIYAIIMTAVVVGTVQQIVEDISDGVDRQSSVLVNDSDSSTTTTTTQSPNQHMSVDIPMSVTTLYFIGLTGIFLFAAMLHPLEAYCLIHGIWYLLCLPSGYLVLTIYSICNITDSSWGTREQASVTVPTKDVPWLKRIREVLEEIFFCFESKASKSQKYDSEVQTGPVAPSAPPVSDSSVTSDSTEPQTEDLVNTAVKQHTIDVNIEALSASVPVPVEDWLPQEMHAQYLQLFKRQGYESTLFISGMTELELMQLGVTSRGHIHFLQEMIAVIPTFEIEYRVPGNVDHWLVEIGLAMYRDNFWRNQIRVPKDMEILKALGRKEIESELGIMKEGHIKRLMYAISKLREPVERQQKAMRMRAVLEDTPTHFLKDTNAYEQAFWENLRAVCLEPDLKAFGLEGEVKKKLAELRNNWLMILAVSNALWIILISSLAPYSELTVLGANPIGLTFVFIYGILFIVQFLSMLVHRVTTVSHYFARAPYRCGRPMYVGWSFKTWPKEQDLEDTADRLAFQQTKHGARRALERLRKPKKRAPLFATPEVDETKPLLS